MFPLSSNQLFVQNSMKSLHVYFSLEIYGHFTDYGISLVLGGPFSLKTLLQESSPVRARQVRRTVEFPCELLSYKKITKASIRTSRKTSSLRVASQGLSHLFLKTFAAVSPDPTDRPWVSEDGS